MHDTLQALMGLQEIDRDIFRVEAELRRLPKELEARQAQLDVLAKNLAELRQSAIDMRRDVKEIDDLTTTQRQRIRKLEGEANKAKSDAATVAAFEHEIRTLKRTVSKAEEDGLELLEQVEQVESQIAERVKVEAEELSTFAEFQANVVREQTAAEQLLGELRGRVQETTSSSINPDHLELYKRLISTREGEAIAELQGRICQGCFVEIPKNLAVRLARGTDLVQCQACDRILYVRY